MDYALIELHIEQGIATLTLNRPDKRNAMSDAMRREFVHALEQVTADKAIKALVLTGAGKGFCAGGDISGMKERMNAAPGEVGFNGWHRQQGVHHAQSLLHTCPKPVIAAVNGYAVGIGAIITFCCDLIIASENATFALPEPRVGLAALAGGLHRLPRLIGLKRAMGMILTGRRVGAKEGVELGFVNEVAPAGEARTGLAAGSRHRGSSGATAVRSSDGFSSPPSADHTSAMDRSAGSGRATLNEAALASAQLSAAAQP